MDTDTLISQLRNMAACHAKSGNNATCGELLTVAANTIETQAKELAAYVRRERETKWTGAL